MVIWVALGVYVAATVGFVVYDHLVLSGVSDFYSVFDAVMVVVTIVLLLVWVYILCVGFGII